MWWIERQDTETPKNFPDYFHALFSGSAIVPDMTKHKYKIGHRVTFAKGMTSAASGEYEIVRLLPWEGADFNYRIKSPRETHERVAREDQLELLARN